MGHLNGILKEYMQNSSLHAVKFLIDNNISFMERVFWLMAIILSWIGSCFLMLSALDAFHHHAISFVVETSYRDWTTNFPSVVICESKNNDRIQEIADSMWGPDHDFALEEILNELAFFRGESYHAIRECGEEIGVDCIQMNFSDITNMVRSSCKDVFNVCRWNSEHFDCCSYFLPMQTEVGICYALNSIHTEIPNGLIKKPWYNTSSNKYTGPGNLYMELKTESNIYTIGEEEVPNLVSPKTEILSVGPSISYTRKISVRNIENDPLTRDVSVEQRHCRYTDENILDVHKYYSYSACTVQCRKDQQLSTCNCTSHLIPNMPQSMHCHVDGLRCLSDHYEELSVVIAKWSNKKGVVCDCLPSCTEIDIGVVHDTRDDIYDQSSPLSMVTIGLASLPNERYKRNVIRGTLDLVVSIGGTAGLFVGASLLSFIEIFYYFIVRPYYCIQNKPNQEAQ